MSKDTVISIRVGDDILKKLDIITSLLNEKNYNLDNQIVVSKSEVIKSAIEHYYFLLATEDCTGIVYDAIVGAINTYLRSQVRVDNYFKNNLLTEVIINQELMKQLLTKHNIRYEELAEIIQDRVNERITKGGNNGQ